MSETSEKDYDDLMRSFRGQLNRSRVLDAVLADKTRRLADLKRSLTKAMEDIEAAQMPTTGWVVFLKRTSEGKWQAVGCFDSNNYPDDLPECDQIMAIPQPWSLPEWEGP